MSDEQTPDVGLVQAGPPPAGDPLVGTTLKGTYQVVRKVAEGGMGIVYEGEHVRLKRRVAIKVLLAQYARHPEVIARFRREAEVVGGLGHPHIVQVFDVDETDQREPFLVMEYLVGSTLAERLERDARLPVATAVRVATQVASALASTHEQGIVHRDLKPENVFLVQATGQREFAKVLDFGISKVRGGGPRLTAQNMVIGTPAYMAPEQARGERDVDHRVDQFALAAMTYEMLAGRSPFPGDDPVEIMKKVIAEDPPPLTEIAPWVPSALDGVVRRGLKKRADERFPNISEFAAALEDAISGIEIAATVPPASTSERAGPTLRRETAGAYAMTEPRTEKQTASRSDRPTPASPSRGTATPVGSGRRPSSPPRPLLIEEARVPPAPSPEHRVEHFTPASRRIPSSPVSKRPATGPSSPVPSAIAGSRKNESPTTVPPYERISRAPSTPPPVSRRGVTTPAGNSDPNVIRAEQSLNAARGALKLGNLNEAVQHAEQLLELVVFGKDTAVYEVLRAAMPVVDQVFEARVGPLDRRLEITLAARDPKKLNLSDKAAFILSCAEGGATIQEVIDVSGIPRRDAIRMLAGLMRRGALVAH